MYPYRGEEIKNIYFVFCVECCLTYFKLFWMCCTYIAVLESIFGASHRESEIIYSFYYSAINIISSSTHILSTLLVDGLLIEFEVGVSDTIKAQTGTSDLH
jgi:hypothetical protein